MNTQLELIESWAGDFQSWAGDFPREEQTSEVLAALQKTEIATHWPILKAAGIKAE